LVSYIYSWGENHIFMLKMFIIEFDIIFNSDAFNVI